MTCKGLTGKPSRASMTLLEFVRLSPLFKVLSAFPMRLYDKWGAFSCWTKQAKRDKARHSVYECGPFLKAIFKRVSEIRFHGDSVHNDDHSSLLLLSRL